MAERQGVTDLIQGLESTLETLGRVSGVARRSHEAIDRFRSKISAEPPKPITAQTTNPGTRSRRRVLGQLTGHYARGTPDRHAVRRP